MVNKHFPTMKHLLEISNYITLNKRYDKHIQRDNNLWKATLITLNIDKRIKKLVTSHEIMY